MSASRTIARMVGLSEDAGSPELSPRQKLRTCISTADAARAELQVIRSAVEWSGGAGLAVERAEVAVETAKAALEASKRGSAQSMVARALGTAEGAGIPIAQARLDLQVCEDEFEAAKIARAALQSMIPEVENKLYWAVVS
jgi:hypothetical protein